MNCILSEVFYALRLRAKIGGLLLLTLFAIPTYAGGMIDVALVDSISNRPLSGAQVAIEPRDGQQQIAVTNRQGRVLFKDLASGLYELVVVADGYLTYRGASLRVSEGKSTSERITLAPLFEDVERILVTSSSRAVNYGTAASTGYMNREQLRTNAGSGGDVLRALDGLPGLFSSGAYSSFTVRGRGPNDNLILVDGIPFRRVIHFADSFGEPEELEGGGRFSIFAPNVIAGAEFQPGGWSPAYAGGAASLLNLEVAEGNRSTSSYSLRVDLSGLELGYDGPSQFDDDTSLLLTARRLDFGQVFETVGVEDIGSPTLTDIVLKTSTELDDNNKLNLLAIHAPEKYVRNLQNALASDKDEPGNWEDLELARSKADNQLLAIHWQHFMGEDLEFNQRLYWRNYAERLSLGEAMPYLVPYGSPDEQIPVSENILSSRAAEKELGWRFDVTWQNALGWLDAGTRMVNNQLSYQQTLNDESWVRYEYETGEPDPGELFVTLNPVNTNSQFDKRYDSYAAFVNQNVELDGWVLRAGIRYDRDGLTGESLVSPRFGSFWQFSDQLQLTTALGIYYQAPAFAEVAADSKNVALESEKTTQLSLGARYFLGTDYELFAEVYTQKLENLIVESNGLEQLFVNTGEGYSRGVDVGLSRRFAGGWSAQMNYSYNRARTRDTPTSAYYDADFSRTHYFGMSGEWEMNEKWRFSARYKRASGAPKDLFTIHEDVNPDSGQLRFSKEITGANLGGHYGSYSSINFRADYRVQLSWTELVTFLDIINLLGSENPSATEFNERTGKNAASDGQAIILYGVKMQW